MLFLANTCNYYFQNGFTANWTNSVDADDSFKRVFIPKVLVVHRKLYWKKSLLRPDGTWSVQVSLMPPKRQGTIRIISGSQNATIVSPTVNMTQPTNLTVKAKRYDLVIRIRFDGKVNNEQVAAFTTTAENLTFTVDIPAKTASSKLSFRQ